MKNIGAFRFDRKVVDVFPDMIKRSVPGYNSIIAMLSPIAERYAQPGTNLYDLGCSLGAGIDSMQNGIKAPDCTIVGVDNSPEMIETCRNRIRSHNAQIEICPGDVRDIKIENASMVVLNFTLQFIPAEDRRELLTKIYKGMRPGGILVLSEKVIFEDEHLNELLTDLHHEFKLANGYSCLEISQKRSALENVLIPETIATHTARLQSAGFSSCDVWFQCFNFTSLIALK